MASRGETIRKWLLYGLSALLLAIVQLALLQRIRLFGVIPFVWPLLALIPASYEGPLGGGIFALACGVVCDLLLPSPIPCLYTLVFPLAAILTAFLAVPLRSGISCSLLSGVLGFSLIDLVRFLTLRVYPEVFLSVALRELLVTLPLCVPVTLLYAALYRRTHENDSRRPV